MEIVWCRVPSGGYQAGYQWGAEDHQDGAGRAEDHHNRADRTEDPHGGANDNQGGVDGAEDHQGGADDPPTAEQK